MGQVLSLQTKSHSDIEVIDDFVPEEVFAPLCEVLMNDAFPWFFQNHIAYDEPEDDVRMYLSHLFYQNFAPNSSFFDLVAPIIDLLNPRALIRVRANLHPWQGPEIHQHQWHNDQFWSHTAALLSINTNNGFTEFKNGEKVDSVENRLVKFDGVLEHRSSTCTDSHGRMNVIFHYFGEDH